MSSIWDLGFGISDLGFRILVWLLAFGFGFGFRVLGFGFGFGFGFQISNFKISNSDGSFEM